VRAFLLKYYGAEGHAQTQSLFDPVHTVTTKARFGLVTIHGEQYAIADIGMRMLQPHELFAAQGFPDHYDISPELNGKPLTKTAQIALAGNSARRSLRRWLLRTYPRTRRGPRDEHRTAKHQSVSASHLARHLLPI
jgi:DNA (cytosine-5)-methyltransferase 1